MSGPFNRPLPNFLAADPTVLPESSGVIKMIHWIGPDEQEPRIYNMRLQADRDSFVKFASWASRNSVTFTCYPL